MTQPNYPPGPEPLGADFLAWVRDTFTTEHPHVVFPGWYVRIGKIERPHVLTAAQACHLAQHLLRLAERGEPL